MNKIYILFSSFLRLFIQWLPEEFSAIRIWYFNRKGVIISKKARLYPNIYMRGKIVIGDYCKIDQMTYLFGDYNEGIRFGNNVSIAPNCRIQGKVFLGDRSSMAQNGTISGENEGVYIDEDVMIGPNVVIVAFNHGFDLLDVPMRNQSNIEKPVFINKNVWIGANVTIGKGVIIGEGSIIGSNSFVNKNIPPYCIAGGVPAKVLRHRKSFL